MKIQWKNRIGGMMKGLYRKGGKNTTSEEVDEFDKITDRLRTYSLQVVCDELIDFINRVSLRAYEEGRKSKVG